MGKDLYILHHKIWKVFYLLIRVAASDDPEVYELIVNQTKSSSEDKKKPTNAITALSQVRIIDNLDTSGFEDESDVFADKWTDEHYIPQRLKEMKKIGFETVVSCDEKEKKLIYFAFSYCIIILLTLSII